MSVCAPFLTGRSCFSRILSPVWAVFFFPCIHSTAPHLTHISLSLSPGGMLPPARETAEGVSPILLLTDSSLQTGSRNHCPHVGGHLLALQTVLWRATVLKTCGKPSRLSLKIINSRLVPQETQRVLLHPASQSRGSRDCVTVKV